MKDIFDEYWFKSALIRAIKTFAQTFISSLTGIVLFTEINWFFSLSMSCFSFILSLLTSLAGLPEVKDQSKIKQLEIEKNNYNIINNKLSKLEKIINDVKRKVD